MDHKVKCLSLQVPADGDQLNIEIKHTFISIRMEIWIDLQTEKLWIKVILFLQNAQIDQRIQKKSRSEEFHFGGLSRLLHVNRAREPHVNLDSFTVNATH